MRNAAPVLIIGFNRPEHLASTIRALASSRPESVLLAVDGPRPGSPSDAEKCIASQKCVDAITWPCRIETRFRNQNLGIRFAVADAVNWAIDLYGCVTVLEDDAEPGPEAISFADSMLKRHAPDSHIGHISLYNVVPKQHLTRPHQPTRLSNYPESYAWATWHRAWKYYDDDLSWVLDTYALQQLLESRNFWKSQKWRRNLRDAQAGRIDTWAYRWVASLWRHHLECVSPNRNLVRYTGQKAGTHTRRRQRWNELNISELPLETPNPPALDVKADAWLTQNVFRETAFGYVEGLVASSALALLGALRRK